jgi:hypothetical protein
MRGQQGLASAARRHWGRAADVMVEAKGKEHALAPMGVEIV